MGNNLSSQSERSFRIPKQSIVIEPEQREEQFCEPDSSTKGGSSIQRLDHTNHHVDVLWFQATKKFSSQTDPFKVHKNSPKNFKPILRNHLEKEKQNHLLIEGTTTHMVLHLSYLILSLVFWFFNYHTAPLAKLLQASCNSDFFLRALWSSPC